MNKSQIFKKAHKLAKQAHVVGESYQVTFSAALRIVHQESNMIDKDKEAASILIGADDDAVMIKVDGKYWVSNKETSQNIICTKQQAKENNYWIDDDDSEIEDALAALGF